MSELADHWLRSNPAKRPRTLDRDREIVGAAAAASGPSRRVVSVTRADVQRLVGVWRAELALSTVRRMYMAGRAMFDYAEAAELIPGALVVISGYRLLSWWTARPSRSTSWPR